MPKDGLSALIEAACRLHRNRVATWQADGAPVSFASYFGTIIAFAERLQDEGVGAGTRVSVAIADGIAGRMLVLALLRLGATVLPDLALLPGVEADLRLAQAPDPARPERSLTVTPDWIRSPTRLVPIAGGGRLVKTTSGTTGLPKLRMVDEVGLATILGRSDTLRGQATGTVYIGYSPSSSPGINIGIRTLLSGAAQVLQPAATEDWLQAIIAHQARLACLPPGSFAELLSVVEERGTDGVQLQEIRVGGGQLSPALALRGEALFGCPVVNTYGSNETGSIAHHRPALSDGVPGIVGQVYPDLALRFVDEAGVESDPATGGRLLLKLPQEIWVRDYPSGQPLCDAQGWQDTGDLARCLPDGRLQLLGRVSDLLNIGGDKIAPVRIEVMAAGFPGLEQIAAFPAMSEMGMEQVGLAVVAGAGFQADAFLAHMAERLGPRRAPVLAVLASLPMTPAGKIDRPALTRIHQARVHPANTKETHR